MLKYKYLKTLTLLRGSQSWNLANMTSPVKKQSPTMTISPKKFMAKALRKTKNAEFWTKLP